MSSNAIGSRSSTTMTCAEYPIIVRNACKSYSLGRTGENSALLNLNMTVPKGTIYGILGPSGCGKTTLLRCIIGRLALDRGHILTLGRIPGSPNSGIPGSRVGYMPQEESLDGVMSIMEILNYYGSILGVDKKEIQRKMKFIFNFLKLPSKKTKFNALSGGQKRRVSFAVALIHDAELLILDEPTVGVDPILKQSIWDYLFELVQSGKTTVIITTHYIEEARGANTVAMMFNGRLLAEDAPEKLITRYGVQTLEEVFFRQCLAEKISSTEISQNSVKDCSEQSGAKLLKSCSKLLHMDSKAKLPIAIDGRISDTNEPLPIGDYVEVVNRPMLNIFNIFFRSFYDIKIRRLQAVIYRSLIQFIRFPALVVLLIAAPAFQIALCGFSLGRSVHSVPLGVVNKDAGHLGDLFLSFVSPNVIVQKNYSTWELARQGARDGETLGAIMFGHNFSMSIVERFNHTPHVDRKTLLESCINVSLDGSSFLFVETIRFTLLHAFEMFVDGVLNEFSLELSLAKIPLLREDPIFGKLEDPFSVFIVPSFITGSTFFAEMGLSIIIFFLDKEGGKLERVYVAGVTPVEIMCGFLVLQMVILLMEVFLMLVVAFLIFQFNNYGSILLIVTLAVLQGLCGAMIGILVASSSKRFPDTSSIVMTILVSATAVGGYFWPLEATSSTVRLVCMLLPFGISANAMRHIMYRRWDLTHSAIQRAFGVSVLWIVMIMCASLTVFRMKKSTGNR